MRVLDLGGDDEPFARVPRPGRLDVAFNAKVRLLRDIADQLDDFADFARRLRQAAGDLARVLRGIHSGAGDLIGLRLIGNLGIDAESSSAPAEAASVFVSASSAAAATALGSSWTLSTDRNMSFAAPSNMFDS